jgi:hypothetical protein
MGKMFSLILNQRLVNYLNVNDIYSDYQFGFRQNRQTSDNIFILNEVMRKYRTEGKKLYVCFIYFRKAFDKVDRTALMLKLLNVGIGGTFYQSIKSMYSKNLVSVKVDSGRTAYFECTQGVRQGDGLSPTLFNVFVNDLVPILLNTECEPAMYGNVPMGCLLYADDLIIISESQNGFENGIKNLLTYCDKWKLKVNTDKSKVMVTCKKKSKQVPHHKFKIHNAELEYVHEYKYLGVIISSTGSFALAQEHLASKGLKGWFSIRNGLYHQQVWDSNVYLHSFDTAIKPILLYGSEIWGMDLINKKDSSKFSFPKLDSSYQCERIHIKICKYVLRVPKSASNSATLAEFGRLPITLCVIKNMLKYYCRLENVDPSSLLGKIYLTSKLEYNRLLKCLSFIQSAIGYTQTHDTIDFDIKMQIKQFTKEFDSHLRAYYKKKFFLSLNPGSSNCVIRHNRKLDTYRHIKKEYTYEPYLKVIKDPFSRKLFTRLRISAHNLHIESGRYRSVKRENRFCHVCKTPVIEDEFHFILKCPVYDNIRKQHIQPVINHMKNNNEWEQFMYIMSTQCSTHILHVAKFILEGMNKRHCVLST